MSSLFTDYGYWDGIRITTNAPDKVSARPTAEQVGRLVYEASQHAETARISMERMERVAESLNTWKANDEARQAVIDSCRDVEMALAAAIAKLCPEPKARPVADWFEVAKVIVDPDRKIPLAVFEQVSVKAAE